MNRNRLRALHRSIFIFFGIFIVAWLLSGLFMAMPADWFGPSANYRNPPADWGRVTLSPAAAIARATGQADAPATRDFRLRQVGEHLLYGVTLADGSDLLVDASDGSRFEFTPQLAEAIVRNAWRVEAPLQAVETLTSHTPAYTWGSLPAWHLTFQDAPSTDYYIGQDLNMFRSSPLTRVRAAIMSLHEFEPVALITDNSKVRKGLLLLVGSIALAGAIIGLLLALPGRRS